MFSNKFSVSRAGVTMAAALAVVMTALPSFAQDQDEEREQITVTGSRLTTNPNLAGASPVLSVTGAEVDLRGTVRIEDFTNILPQVFSAQASEVSNGATGTAQLDLRGLGPVRTLVMIDGHRLPYGDSSSSAPNLDLIPTQLIERVDILTGGASAVYGSDAVAGVANFILKKDFEGIELDVLGGSAQNSNSGHGLGFWDNVLNAASQPSPGKSWDGEEYSIALTLGANTSDGRGNVTLFASYENRKPIRQADRTFSACALGQDNGAESFGGFGCVGSSNFRRFFTLSPDPLVGGDGFQLEDGTIVNFAGGPSQTFNFGPFNFFQRPSERFQIYARGHYDLTDDIEVFADVSFLNNSSDAQIAPSASFGTWSINCDNPLIQGATGPSGTGLNLATDIFGCTPAEITAGTDVGVFASHRNVEGGPRSSRLENTAWRMITGFRGTVLEQWDFETFFQFSRTEDVDFSSNDFVVANVQQAFFAVDDGNGNVVCRDPSGGCVPYNIFQRGPGGESLVTQDALSFIQGIGITTGSTEQLIVGGNVQTDLGNYGIKSPFTDAGVGFLLGFEFRDDDLSAVPDEISQVPGGGFTGVGGATLPVEGSIQAAEFFLEAQIPLATDMPFIHELTFSTQYRFSDYDTDGNGASNSFSTDAYGFQLTWAPIEDVKFRGQFQRAVRAPNVIELFEGQNTDLPNLSSAGTNTNGVQLFDPCSSSAPIASLAACQNSGVTPAQFGSISDVISGQTQSITGGNPDLRPEESDTFTIGVVISPAVVPSLTVSIDYFDIEVSGFISEGISAQVTLDNCLATGNATFCNLITRSATGSLVAGIPGVGFTQTNLNIANVTTSGIDFQVLYDFDLADVGAGELGHIRLDFAATYLDEFDFVPFPGGQAIKCAGKFGNNCGDQVNPVNPQYRHRLLTTWETPWDLAVTMTWRFVSSVDNDNASDTLEKKFDAQQYLDLSFNYQLIENINLRGGILNLLNNQPPVFSSAGPALGNGNTYPVAYDTGRFLFLGANFSF